ncbi:hypothetical protein VPH35_133516 [Triticum aestivum]
MASQGVASMLALALLLGAFASIPESVKSIGVCYGMSANNLLAAITVVGMFKSNGIKSMRLYAPNQAACRPSTPNHVLSNLAASLAAAATWVRINIQVYPKVSFRCVCVGNEVAGGTTRNLVPAMKNMHGALASAGLGHIKVTTSVSQAILGLYSPPSAGSFTAEAAAFMGPVVQFLARTRAPLMANIYPLPGLGLQPDASGTVVQDGGFGYQNLFDTTVDAFYTAMAKHSGSNVKLVVSESGWSSGGGTAHLINHVGRGTPCHQGAIETYIFAMFNENQKASGVEQHSGLFYPNMQHVYPISF